MFHGSRKCGLAKSQARGWIVQGEVGGRGRDRTGDPLLAKPDNRLQQLVPFSLTTNVSQQIGESAFCSSCS